MALYDVTLSTINDRHLKADIRRSWQVKFDDILLMRMQHPGTLDNWVYILLSSILT